ncbi:hypothetical protein J5Y09_16330 [Roseomonas sp. PWR1]|uniref:Major facilitator superfamily (MFS) profile domain-containing protein n=1 Tax=Roseomonas nitratireducens TaxID=2820810 RepID=A0ABS4AW49_9PROT|nr:hypothetical protein [Neoroseomonas nitratireducens]MBP0465494.1 hypothetical protein [Neoroseomonas nitratireducens]
MVSRSDILVLGLTAGIVGSLVGGLLLYAGLALVMAGSHAGWLLALPAAPAGGGLGLLLARRLAAKAGPEGG